MEHSLLKFKIMSLEEKIILAMFISELEDAIREMEQDQEPIRELTLGEIRMRINFDAPEIGKAYAVKADAAKMINTLEALKNDIASTVYDDITPKAFHEYSKHAFREIALAQTEVEKSTFFVVKAFTNPLLA